MSLPVFVDRVLDATTPVMGGLDRDVVTQSLSQSKISIVFGDSCHGPKEAGAITAANLAARLYPEIHLSGPAGLVSSARDSIISINPKCAVVVDEAPDLSMATLAYEQRLEGESVVSVCARGWNVYIDEWPAQDSRPSVSAALMAAALGVGELFRSVFQRELSIHGRTGRQPGGFNLVTLGPPAFNIPIPQKLDLGSFTLVGAGAIGQAAAMTLAQSGLAGSVRVVDGESVTLSNLQRYVLTSAGDVGAIKVDLVKLALSASKLEVRPVHATWDSNLSDGNPVLVGLDSESARIGVQASLPGPIYNAWTQPADIGWSRHEDFGVEPCLACLYWQNHPVPSRHEQIAASFNQHPLRVLAYLVHKFPVGLPLPPGAIPVLPEIQAPPGSELWHQSALIDDIAQAAGAPVGSLDAWRNLPLADLYQEGICGGALLSLDVGEAPREVLVPLAHQSLAAGVMLASQFIVSRHPKLRSARPVTIEGRLDVLRGMPQVLSRPRAITPGCICGDSDFVGVYLAKRA